MPDQESTPPTSELADTDVGTLRDPMWFSIVDDPIVVWARANLVIASAAFAFGLVVIEVLKLANWRVESALAIVAAGDPPKVVSGVALGFLPYLLPPLVLVSWAWYGQLRASGRRAALIAATQGVLVFFAIAVSPLITLAIYLGVYVLAGVLPGILTRRRGTPARGYMPIGEQRTSYFLFLVLFAVLIQLQIPHSWVPREVVGLPGGGELSGYVVGQSAGFTTIVAAKDGTISLVKTEDVVTRTVCHTDNSWIFDSLLVATSTRTSPVCP